MRVHQMTTGLSFGDAISNHILEIDKRLRAWGCETRIFATYLGEGMERVAQHDHAYHAVKDAPDDLLIYHYSIYSPNLELYRQSRNRKLVIYHNITPPEFYRGYSEQLADDCLRGRVALYQLTDCHLGVGDSDYNRRELVAAGVPAKRTAVLPIFLILDDLLNAPFNSALAEKMTRPGRVNLLFVGRLVPSKGVEDLVKLLAVYRYAVHRDTHLWLVGNPLVPLYRAALERQIERLGQAEAVTLAEHVSLGELRTFFSLADVFVCASRHEGFGVPLVESMAFDLPILAYACTAVPDTLGPAGALFHHFDYPVLAETLHRLVMDEALRQTVIAGQRARLADFAPDKVEAQLKRLIERVMPSDRL